MYKKYIPILLFLIIVFSLLLSKKKATDVTIDSCVAQYAQIMSNGVKDYDAALTLAETCMKKFPNSADITYMRGTLYAYNNEKEKALQSFDTALELLSQGEHTINEYAILGLKALTLKKLNRIEESNRVGEDMFQLQREEYMKKLDANY